MLQNVRLRNKLWILLFISLISLGSLTVISTISLQKITGNKTELFTASEKILNADRDMYQALLAKHKLQMVDKNHPDYVKWLDSFHENSEQVIDRVNEVTLIDQNVKETFLEHYNDWVRVALSLIEGESATSYSDSELDMALFNQARDQLDLLGEKQHELIQNRIQEDEAVKKRTLFVLYGSSAIAFILLIALSVLIIRSITKPMTELIDYMSEVANGNLSKESRIQQRDEIGQLAKEVQKMVDNLKRLLHQIHDSSTTVSASAEQLAASANESSLASEHVACVTQDTSDGAKHQLEQITVVNQSVKNISDGLHQMAEDSNEMVEAVNRCRTNTEDGNKTVSEIVRQMNNIQTAVTETKKRVETLGEHSKEIGEITKMISSIAEQTNLLSLNAAIEAARAGESGKGFAVVADEVRNLAVESKKSTEQIKQMIEGMQKETEWAIRDMSAGDEQVNEGIIVTEKVTANFKEIENSINQLDEKVQNVASSVKQINHVSNEIVQAIDKVHELAEKSLEGSEESAGITEEQLAAMEEITASAQSLSKLAEDLQKLIQFFK